MNEDAGDSPIRVQRAWLKLASSRTSKGVRRRNQVDRLRVPGNEGFRVGRDPWWWRFDEPDGDDGIWRAPQQAERDEHDSRRCQHDEADGARLRPPAFLNRSGIRLVFACPGKLRVAKNL